MITYACVCDDLPPHEHVVQVAPNEDGVLVGRRSPHIAKFWVDWRTVAREMMRDQEEQHA